MFSRDSVKGFSFAGCVVTLLFLLGTNVLQSGPLWGLLCLPPLLMWPYSAHKGLSLGNFNTAIGVSGVIAIYYAALNTFMFTGHPWSGYIAFALLWYPASVYFAKRKMPFQFSVFGLIWTVLFFSWVNYITTPDVLWAVFPVFAVAWWPLSLYFFVYR